LRKSAKLRVEVAQRRDEEREKLAWEVRQKVDQRLRSKLKSRGKDDPFQKGLCWASYYKLVYMVFCMFMPGHVASAAEKITDLVGIELTAPVSTTENRMQELIFEHSD
jgi:hypothetical protein